MCGAGTFLECFGMWSSVVKCIISTCAVLCHRYLHGPTSSRNLEQRIFLPLWCGNICGGVLGIPRYLGPFPVFICHLIVQKPSHYIREQIRYVVLTHATLYSPVVKDEVGGRFCSLLLSSCGLQQ